ncbi:ABC transporter permease [Flavipsychrobacter stenotrophus]|uniref:Transport permease protein n=1 Tax=Flavipsychrobacter stenotrophus TaxID=2077091 RepID=A0A2S7SY67_9BACT|nr:ABC transporter permease [Flavipsychrobacter stenotrophus]PQJ11648.1 ABC transporter permease [Flavipsychrobacter stenotrophus]
MNENRVINDNTEWDSVIGEQKSQLNFNFKEIWRYRDLLILFVKRDIVTVYKQTILGPIWFLLQPVFTTIIYVAIFGRVAKIPIGTAPPILFYLGSVTLWNYFSDTLNITSKTFTDNATVFGKVYFPRLILPLSKVLSGIIKLGIQFSLFFVVWIYYIFINKQITPTLYVFTFPLILLTIAMLSLGVGIIITSMTTKYRDLTFLVSFAVQLLMYATPIIYPISTVSAKNQIWLWLNPLTSLFEAFKFAFLGEGVVNFFWLSYSVLFTFVVTFIGILVFNKVEKRFIDSV